MYIKEIKKENKPILKKDFLVSDFSKGCPATFDKDTGMQNCEMGKRRSFTDLYKLVKYYYPLTSKKGLIRVLQKVAKEIPIRGLFCDATNRVVFFVDNSKKSQILFSSQTYNSDATHRNKFGDDNISMNLLEDWMI